MTTPLALASAAGTVESATSAAAATTSMRDTVEPPGSIAEPR
jgi:hypothetical protein